MGAQVTLLISHKGVDLHAATAARVMRDRLAGGERLVALGRAEFHTFWPQEAERGAGRDAAGAGESRATVAALLAAGRVFNPNKHHYGHFELSFAGERWSRPGFACRGQALPAGWPGTAVATDLGRADAGLLERLLGRAAGEAAVVDVCAFALAGDEGPVLSGVVWRLVLAPGREEPAALADALTVARGASRGLLVNPHLQGWLTAVRAVAGNGTD